MIRKRRRENVSPFTFNKKGAERGKSRLQPKSNKIVLTSIQFEVSFFEILFIRQP